MGGTGSGRKKDPPKPKKILKEVIPVDEIFNEDEASVYYDLVDIYLADFDKDDLTSSDMDDILDLAKNRVLEFRLLKTSKNNVDRQIDISSAVEKIKKENKVLKENLSSRRKDRINPNEFKGFSIVDLAVAFDEERKAKLMERININRQKEQEMLRSREDYSGNRYDHDAKKSNKEEDF